jgi:hypothetical protein
MTEAQLIDRFEKYILRTYPLCDLYKVYSTSYVKQGHPDLQFCKKGIKETYYIEVKKDKSIELAIKQLRPTQIGRMRELHRAGQLICLLYDGGCGLLVESKPALAWINHIDKECQFQGFDIIISITQPGRDPQPMQPFKGD